MPEATAHLESPVGAGKDLHEVLSETDVMVEMRDGICLATDIHRPAANGTFLDGPFPVLVERTPYGKNNTAARERKARDQIPMRREEVGAYFAQRGYVVVIQDCRGRYRSQGHFTKYIGEANDGYDTLQWIASQPWCNGRIGTYGLSYAAHTQTALATQHAPGLSAMLIDSGGFSNAYRGGIRHGGAFELKQATWAYREALRNANVKNDAPTKSALAAEDIGVWFLKMPWEKGRSPLKAAREYEDYLFEQWEHGVFDDYWQQPELYAAGHYNAFDDIPVNLICGWWDPYAQTTTDNYLGISRRERGLARLVLGPWTHGERSVTFAGDVDFGPQATLDGNVAANYLEFRLHWFNRWLKPSIGQSKADDPVVRYFRMGGGSERRTSDGRLDHGGSWQSATDWPLPETTFTTYYLHANGGLRTMPAHAEAACEFDFDPTHPVPTIGGSITSGEPLMIAGAYDQRTHGKIFGAEVPFQPLAQRPDVMVFETPDLEEDVEVTGPVTMKLWVSSTAPDTDFTAKLIDWHPPNPDYPEGFAMNITDGIIRCRYRNSWQYPELLRPDEIVEITIEPMPTSNLFKKGHRIRLDISSSNFPRFDVNPNSGEAEGKAQHKQPATNRIHMSPEFPSQLLLPVIPGKHRPQSS
jgi:putative CocE/NonD family hydrolase